MVFSGFPAETLGFLSGIAANNSKEWFTANRSGWDLTIAAARDFVEAVGPGLRAISPSVQYEAKIGATLPRVNRDTRLGKNKLPYRDNFDLWFWHGDKKGWDQPGFFLRLTTEGVWIATGMMHIVYPMLPHFRDAIVADRSGGALVATIAKINGIGRYQVGYPSRKSVPKGYDKDAPRAEYLLYESLWGHLPLPADAVLAPDFAEVALKAWAELAPLSHHTGWPPGPSSP
ncbi:MAG: DUF2461 domain-containing protein [Devosia sp.]